MQVWIIAVLYVFAIIIVLFHDCKADRYVPKSQVTWWGYLKSWIKQLVVWHFVGNIVMWRIVLTMVYYLWKAFRWSGKWLTYLRISYWYQRFFPRKPPDILRRERRARRARQAVWALRPVRRRPKARCTKLLAATMCALKLSSLVLEAAMLRL